MKKSLSALILALGLIAVIACFAIPASAARLAPYLSQYDEVEIPADEDIAWSYNNIAIWWDQESIFGKWDMAGVSGNRAYFSGNGTSVVWMDNDLKTSLLSYDGFITATEFVFADAFTAYGDGDYGYSKMQPEDWERFTLAGSADGMNWFEIPFTVKYHLDEGYIWNGTHVSSLEVPADLWWHLVFDEEVTAKYFAFHTSNSASQDDASYELCFLLDTDCMYVIGEEDPDYVPPTSDEPEYGLILAGRTNNFAQWPEFTDNGDGTYGVSIKNGNNVPGSWTDNNPGNGQPINQNSETVWWNLYFPRVYYATGVRATALVWNVHELSDTSDLEDYEIYYSDDSVVWKKAEGVTVTTYDAQLPGGGTEFGANCGAPYGVRFDFANPIEAKFFFAYDPDSVTGNVFHYAGFFAAYVGENAYDTDADTTAPVDTEAETTEASSTTDEGAADTADFAIASLAIAAVAAAGVVLVSKKRK